MIAHKHVFVFNNYDRSQTFTLLVTVNTFCACYTHAANVCKLSYLIIVLMRHTMVFNVQYISSASISYQDG